MVVSDGTELHRRNRVALGTGSHRKEGGRGGGVCRELQELGLSLGV